MEINIPGYWATFRTTLKAWMAYRVDYALVIIFKIGLPLIMLAVWTAVFLNTNVLKIGGFTLTNTYSYFFLMSLLSVAIWSNIDYTMGTDVRHGAIVSSLLRPLSYPLVVLSKALSSWVIYFVTVAIPLLIIMSFVAHLAITPYTLYLFAIEMVLGLILINLLAFFFGTFAITFIWVDPFLSMTWTVESVLEGSMIPLNFFPAYAQHILMLLPFPILAYLPAVTLLGSVSSSVILKGIYTTALWIVVMIPLVYLWWKRMYKRIGSIGG
jgi:ABC-2 type transport system permease protein